jgi:hypothetical protein
MRKYLLIALAVLFLAPIVSFAQVKEEEKAKEPPTKLEAFLAKKGTLIVKDFYELGELRGLGKMQLNALIIYEPGMENTKIRGMRVEITEAGSYGRSNTSFLDLEEVESLSKAIAYMADLAEKWKGINREAYTEVIYATKGDFNVGFYQKGSEMRAFASSGYIGKASFFMEVEDFISMKGIIDKGLSVLKEK